MKVRAVPGGSIPDEPHPSGRGWHMMAAPFASLLEVVMSDALGGPGGPNHWRHDVLLVLRGTLDARRREGLAASLAEFAASLRADK